MNGTGANDSPGIPYVTEPETEAIAQYDRETVAQTYEKIEQDIVESIDKIGPDATYSVPAIILHRLQLMLLPVVFIYIKGIGIM